MIRQLRNLWPASSLGARLGSTLMLALLPLGVLSIVQTRDALNQIDVTTLEGVGGAAMHAVRSQIELIKEAQVSARMLSTVLSRPVVGGPSCVEQVTAIASQIPQATVVAYVPVSGLLTCTSDGNVYDLSENPRFQEILAQPVPGLVYDPQGTISKQAIVGVRQPVFASDGTLAGFVAISLAYTAVVPQTYGDEIARWNPAYLATFTADGRVLVASDPGLPVADAIPGGKTLAELTTASDRSEFVEDRNGRHIVSVISVAPDLFVVSVWRPEDGRWTNLAMPYLMPVLTWIAALVAAAFASSQLVVRHVRALAGSMDDFIASQQRAQIPDLSDPPTEIQRLHAAYEGLILTIEREEAELQNLLVDKENLLREVTHRSGNSLQIMASIMRMYRREATDPGLQQVLDGLINRVIALSSTHTSLYAVSGKQDIAMDEVLSNVVRRLKEIHGVALGVANKQFAPIRMDAQSATPLALALAETVGCYFARPGLSKDALKVTLSETDGTVRLHVEGPVVPELQPGTVAGILSLPQRMLHQFAAQLGGRVTLSQSGDVVQVDLVFPAARRGPDS